MFNKIISDLSCDESAFNNAKVTYELALKHSRYKSEIKYDRQPSARRNRDPPCSLNVKTSNEKLFLKLVRKNFPKSYRIRKILKLKHFKT